MMFATKLCLLLCLPQLILSHATFKNVQVKGYSVFTLKFTKTLHNATTLKEQLPQKIYDHLELKDQTVPVLETNSISDLDIDQLTIEYCGVLEVQPGTFRNLPYLRWLSLKDNLIQEIRTGVFNDLLISTLDLSKNRIEKIEDNALNDLPNLLNINLADNYISIWNNQWFFNVPLLTRISFQNNSLTKIPANAFKNLKGEKKFRSIKLTLNLIFSGNHIEEINSTAFQGVKNLNNLWLDNNQLKTFEDNLLEHVEVQDLRLGYNQITCLNGDLDKLLKATTTHLDGNPFDCICLEKIKKFILEQKRKNVDFFYSDMSCFAKNLEKKITELKNRLFEIQKTWTTVKDVEEVTTKFYSQPEEDVELVF